MLKFKLPSLTAVGGVAAATGAHLRLATAPPSAATYG